MAKLSFLAGFGAGYVLGARAGRGRYEQIRRAWEHAKDDPRLQSIAGMAQARADDAVTSLRNSRTESGGHWGASLPIFDFTDDSTSSARAWAMPATLCSRGSSLACAHARRICS